MLTAGFEPMVSASERPQTYALHRAATGTISPKTPTVSITQIPLAVCTEGLNWNDFTELINFVGKNAQFLNVK